MSAPRVSLFADFGLNLDADGDQVLVDLLTTIAAIIAGHILLLPYTFKTTPKHKHWVDMLDLYFHLIYIPVLVVTAAHNVWSLGGSVHDRWHGMTLSGYINLLLYCAENVVHIPILWFSKDCTAKLFCMYLLHHSISSLSFGAGLFTSRMQYWACLDGLCEISALFLNILFTYQYFELKRGLTYTICGSLLWLSFLVFRIALFPYWLYSFYQDINQNPEITWNVIGPFEKYFYVLTNVLLLVLSTNWFIPITKGFIKALKGSKPIVEQSPKPQGFGQPKTPSDRLQKQKGI